MANNDKLRISRPLVMALIGMAIALGVFISLLTIDFTWTDLIWCVPALAVSAVLVFGGARKLKKK